MAFPDPPNNSGSSIDEDSSVNPYEFYPSAESSQTHGQATQSPWYDDLGSQVPPVDGSYWIAIGLLGLFSAAVCFTPANFWPINFVTVSMGFAGWSLVVLIPLALLRLGLHRRSIAKAILLQTYPGGQRFGLVYLFYSLVFSGVCVLCGLFAFFGICLGIGLMARTGGVFPEMLMLGVSGLLSFAIAIFLLNLGIPKYR